MKHWPRAMPHELPNTFPTQPSVTRPTIALLTDFGLEDPYVGQMKGALAGLAPEALVVDISHQVRPFDVLQGAYYLAASWPHFPQGTVFLAVVDPGVGTERRLLIVRHCGCFFLGPDNGLLALVAGSDVKALAWELTIPIESEVASSTFHGRDILAPVAASLAQGANPITLGRPFNLDELIKPAWATPVTTGGEVTVHILHVDRFGNCLLNLTLQRWLVDVENSPELLAPLLQPLAVARTYSDIPDGGVGMLAGSQGYWELAVNRGSAARVLDLVPGQEVTLQGVAPKSILETESETTKDTNSTK